MPRETKYFVSKTNVYLGAFGGEFLDAEGNETEWGASIVPEDAKEVPFPPEDARQVWIPAQNKYGPKPAPVPDVSTQGQVDRVLSTLKTKGAINDVDIAAIKTGT